MNWFFTFVRVAGTAFPITAPLVTLQSELESDALAQRIKRLENTLDTIHPDAPEASRLIYEKIKQTNSPLFRFEDAVYEKFSRAFASLEAKGYIEQQGALGRRLPFQTSVNDPAYIITLGGLFDDDAKMEKLIDVMESCKIDQWLNGRELQQAIGLPLPVVVSAFEVYEQKRFGIISREIGNPAYCGNA